MVYPTNIAVSLPKGYCARITNISLQYKNNSNVTILDGGIDEVNGRLKIIFFNCLNQTVEIKRGQLIAQLICEKIYSNPNTIIYNSPY